MGVFWIYTKNHTVVKLQIFVYVAAALMEFFCTKDKKIASNIFELGFKKFKDKVGFVTHYLDFLIHLNDDNNTRVLFERVLSADTLSPKDAK